MQPERALKQIAVWAVAIVAALIAVSFVAAWQRARFEPRSARAFVAATGLFEPCISTSTRWIRHPFESEPMAAQHDNPGQIDLDPAGSWITPPNSKMPSSGATP